MNISGIEDGEVLLHVGLHKTGTTALQVALSRAREALPEYGVRYPGEGTFQHMAVLAGAERKRGWREKGAVKPDKQHWNELVAQTQWPGRTIVSSEFLDDVDLKAARRVVEDLGGPQRVRVVVTLRSIGAILPSAWQQQLKSGLTLTYNQWLKKILAQEPGKRAQRFWWRHDQTQQIRRWADIVGADRTYAVVVPDGDRNFIFHAFEGLLGLPENFLVDHQGVTQNRSMTAAEAETVRLLNEQLTGGMDWQEFSTLVRRGAVRSLVENRKPGPNELKLQTPKWAARRAAEIGRGYADALPGLGVAVIGDPEQLAKEPRSGPAERPADLPVAAAVAGMSGIVEEALSQLRAKSEPKKRRRFRSAASRRWSDVHDA